MPPQFQNPTSPVIKPNESPQPNKKKRGLKFIVLGLVLLVVAIGLSLWSAKIKSQESVTDTKNIGTDTSEEFSEWKTYRNEEYGFEFEYLDENKPHKYVLNVRNTRKPKLDTGGAFSGYSLLDYRLYRNDGGLYMEPLWLALSVHPQPFSFQRREEENVYLKLEDAIEHYTNAMWSENRTTRYIGDVQVSEKISENILSVLFLRDTILYEIEMFPADHPVVQKMYSTLKFIDTSTDEIKLIQKCPDEWIQDNMATEHPQYYIIDGQRRELGEFDTTWVLNNCNLEKQVVY